MRTEQKVKEFMQVFQKDNVNETPQFPNSDYLKLRFQLILEELLELAVANGRTGAVHYETVLLEYINKVRDALETEIVPNLLEAFDALIDLRYVVDGAIVNHGMVDIFEKGFEEVHRSNMTKKAKDREEVKRSVEYYREMGISVKINGTDPLVLLDFNTGKALKAIDYSPANLINILDGTIPSIDKLETDN